MNKTPTKNTQPQKELPIIRANKEHINALFGMFAAINELEKAQDAMENRIRAVPNGWRDVKMICSRQALHRSGLLQVQVGQNV